MGRAGGEPVIDGPEVFGLLALVLYVGVVSWCAVIAMAVSVLIGVLGRGRG